MSKLREDTKTYNLRSLYVINRGGHEEIVEGMLGQLEDFNKDVPKGYPPHYMATVSRIVHPPRLRLQLYRVDLRSFGGTV